MSPRPSSSAIELQPPDESGGASVDPSQSADAPAIDSDEVLQSSRLVDSTAPDGGYGWVVVFGCAVMAFWFVGITYSWGVVQGALVREGVASPSTLSFVGSVPVACVAFFAIVNARIIRYLGARNTALLGISLLGGGNVLSGFSAGSVGGLFATNGVVMGVGASICFMVVSVTPTQYFTRKRGLANGIVYAGGGLGGAVISYAMSGLLQHVGPAWTFRVLGFVSLGIGLPAAWLIKERNPIRTTAFLDWSLFHDSRFVIVFFAGAVATFPLFVAPFFLPLYSNSLGLSPGVGAGLVSGFNFSSAVGRVGTGFLSDKVGPLNGLFLALLLSAISMLAIWPISTELAPLVAFVVINGAANGGFFASMPTVVGNVFGSARVSVAMGMVVSGWVAGYLLGAPIAGYLLNAYGGQQAGFEAYRPAIFYAGSMALGASGLVALVRLRINPRLFSKL